MSGRGAWWWAIAGGAALMIAAGAALVLLDAGAAPAPVVRDIRIVGWATAALGAAAGALLDPARRGRRGRRARRALAAVAAAAVAVPALGAAAHATAPPLVLPGAILALGVLLMFRAAAGDATEGE